jgi:hypothetical protein
MTHLGEAAPMRADETRAREVAARHLAAPSTTPDPVVHAAYRALEWQSDRAFAVLTRDDAPARVRVAFTRHANPYSSDKEMIAAVRETRVLEVVTAATDRDRTHPALGCEFAGPYDRFRAVHDIAGHVAPGFGFDPDGELAAWRAQDRLYAGVARMALGSELQGEYSVRWITGQEPAHKATLLPEIWSAVSLCGRSGGGGRSRGRA